MAGRFRMTMESETVILQAGDYLVVPRGKVHTAEVIGSETVVSLNAVKA